MGKIVSDIDALTRIVAGLRTNGKTVVLAPGAFELLHPGHVRYLADARSRGDYLIVAIQEDASVRRAKGAGRPVQPAADRAEVVAALPFVHYVTFFAGPSSSDLCRKLKPSILSRGRDFTERSIPEREAAEETGAQVALAGDARVWSTDQILGKARKKASPGARAARA
jgi:rfaE bifunctional protein nucleotidyltransferase chain/domain